MVVVKPRSDDPRDRKPGPVRPAVPLWFAMLAPPLAALAHVSIGYPMGSAGCRLGSLALFNVLTIAMLLVQAGAGFIGWRVWKRHGSKPPGDSPGATGTRRLMSLIALISAGLFSLIIIAQWFPATQLSPCLGT